MICIMDRALQRLRSFVRGKPHTGAFRFDPESGGMGIRTPDIQLAKLALYQLSYTPIILWAFARVRVGWKEND